MMHKKLHIRLMMQALCIVGLLISIYLYISTLFNQYFCLVGDCATVNNSTFAQIGPIPISLLGIVFYILVIILLTISSRFEIVNILLTVTLFIGLIYSSFLTILEVTVINAICIWCVISFIIIILLNLFFLVHKRINSIG